LEQVGVKVVPSVHLYVDGELRTATGIGTPEAWSEYEQLLYETAGVQQAQPKEEPNAWWQRMLSNAWQ
jgi:hypothetical protein